MSTPCSLRSPSDFRAYQPLGIRHLVEHPRCGLFAGMGTGKTVMALSALESLSLVEDCYPALVLSTVRNVEMTWPEEPAKWSHLRDVKVTPVRGERAARCALLDRALRSNNREVFAVNYEQAEWMAEHLGDEWPFRTVIADESTKLKSFRLRQGSKRAQALAKYAGKTNRWINLTGKPAPNGLVDLWGQTWFVDRGARLGKSFRAFTDRWFQLGRDGYSLTPLPFAQAQIQDALRDVCLTIEGRDYFDLREPVFNRISVDLPRGAKRIYKAMEDQFIADIGGTRVEASNAAVRSGKCLQIASGAVFDGGEEKTWQHIHDAKVDALRDVIEEANGAPVLVAYHWQHDLARLLAAFPQGANLSERAALSAFKRGEVPIGFAHPQSLGHGVDGLQNACNIVAFFSHWWSLDEREQFIERIGPMRQMQAGHDRAVYVHDIVARGTLDEAVLGRHGRKGSVQDALLDYLKRDG